MEIIYNRGLGDYARFAVCPAVAHPAIFFLSFFSFQTSVFSQLFSCRKKKKKKKELPPVSKEQDLLFVSFPAAKTKAVFVIYPC